MRGYKCVHSMDEKIQGKKKGYDEFSAGSHWSDNRRFRRQRDH